MWETKSARSGFATDASAKDRKTMSNGNRKRHGCLRIFLLAIILAFAISSLISLCTGGGPLGFLRRVEDTAAMGADESPDLDEKWTYGSGENKVVHIPLSGTISVGTKDGFFSAPGHADIALMSIRRATNDEKVMAIIIELDSGGGGITASDIIYQALIDFKKAKHGRHVIALCGDLTASGAYYIALAADHIIARPTTVTGSIGVLVQGINLLGLGDKLGIEGITVKSGENKDLLNPLTEFTENQRLMLQEVVDELHSRFVDLVVRRRDLPPETVADLADGSVFTATHAQTLGLVDEIGYWKDAMTRTAEILGVDRVIVYRYEAPFSFSSIFSSRMRWNPAALLESARQIRFYYKWQL